MRALVPPALLLMMTQAGCIDQIADIWGGLTTQLVVEGIVLGVDEPDIDAVDLSGTDFAPGTGFTTFLADAGEVRDLESAPISGATVQLEGVTAPEASPGLYLYADSGLVYQDNADWTLTVNLNGDIASADLTLPPEANVTVPFEHTGGTPMTLALSGQPYDSVLVVVIDEGGNVVFSNEPETITELYEFTHGADIADITIPGSAFANDSVTLVGIAGMVTTSAADVSNMNTALSAVLAGKMKLFPVCTLDPTACGQL